MTLTEKIRGAQNQREKLFSALKDAPYSLARPMDMGGRPAGRWLAISEILRLGIAQYGTRIHELRRQGHQIENWKEFSELDGCYHSWYRLVQPGDPDFRGGQRHEK